jgi:hypothetical protein
MIFVGSGSVTLSECDINELHISLKDLADKTRRGLRGRVENGKSVARCNWLVRDKARRAEETFDETAGGLEFDDARRLLRGPKPMGPRLP